MGLHGCPGCRLRRSRRATHSADPAAHRMPTMSVPMVSALQAPGNRPAGSRQPRDEGRSPGSSEARSSRPRRAPLVTNGLAVCKIHHAAYDHDLMSVTPSYRVLVHKAILQEIDRPMLRHGLQEVHDLAIALPRRLAEQPDRDLLARRHAALSAETSVLSSVQISRHFDIHYDHDIAAVHRGQEPALRAP